MTDFEMAMRNALRKLYPQSKLFTCWFHFTQAVKRHASQIQNFTVKIRTNKAAQQIYYKLMCLPLLPAGSIVSAFEELKLDSRAVETEINSEFEKFIRYFERQWILKVNELNIIIAK